MLYYIEGIEPATKRSKHQSIQNMPASKVYGVRADELLALVKCLEADVTNSLVDAQAADWGRIGDLGRALEPAQQLRDLLRGKAN